MLTRFRVHGFKNLVDVDIRFGPFTCIAGLNGVGKSNLFDALLFLRELADHPFVEAAQAVRGGGDLRSLFTAQGNGVMHFSVDMLIPRTGVDEFGQKAEASSTFVRYRVDLRLRKHDTDLLRDEVELIQEELRYFTKRQAARELGFRHSSEWRENVVHADRNTAFISTIGDLVRLHQDQPRQEGAKKRGGRTWDFSSSSLPRTVLSSARNAQESPTAVLVRLAMRTWRLLQLEPTALRRPDNFRDDDKLGADGGHLAATLYRLTQEVSGGRLYAEISNRLAELIQGVKAIRVERDDSRRQLTLVMEDLRGIELPASSLSDGTLRFIALAVLEKDPDEIGVLCLEEPENGIHPERIGIMLRVLQDIAVDPSLPPDSENPLRQVIVNTHSPVVVGQVPEETLLFADLVGLDSSPRRPSALRLRAIERTWRMGRPDAPEAISLGEILSYLNSNEQAIEVRTERTRGLDSKATTVNEYVRRQMEQLSLFEVV